MVHFFAFIAVLALTTLTTTLTRSTGLGATPEWATTIT
jgi:hypothetical protein